jgi:hypothetical protein
MSDIFLSYKSEDKERAQIIAEALELKGYSVWWDRIIPPGRRFSQVIQEELDAAKCVVVLWSKESVKSEWVETEASEGNRRRILIPVMIDDVLPPLAFRMIEAAKLMDWDGTSDHEEFDLLLESIAGILGQSPAAKNWGKMSDETKIKDKEPKRHHSSPSIEPMRRQNPASHPLAVVQEQILTKNYLLGTWSCSPAKETYVFCDDNSFYYEGFYTGNTCYIGTYSISGSLLNMEINTSPVSKSIAYIDQNTILINSKSFKRTGDITSSKLVSTEISPMFL